MNRSTLLGVTGLAVILAGAAGIAIHSQRPTGELAQGEKLFAALPGQLAQVASIEVTRRDAKFSIRKQGEAWVLPEKGGYPARADLVRQTLSALTEMETVEAKTAKPDLHSRLQLEDPTAPDAKSVRLTLKNEQGAALADLIVGKKRTGPAAAAAQETPMFYVRRPDGNQTWLVQAQIDARATPVDWANRDLMDIPMEDLSRVELRNGDAAPLVLTKAGDAKDFTVENVPAGRKAKSGWDVNALAGVLETLNFEDVQPAAGLTPPASPVQGIFQAKDGLSVTISLIPKEAETWATIAVTGPAEKADPITARTGGWAFRLPDYKRDRLQKTMADVLEPEANTGG